MILSIRQKLPLPNMLLLLHPDLWDFRFQFLFSRILPNQFIPLSSSSIYFYIYSTHNIYFLIVTKIANIINMSCSFTFFVAKLQVRRSCTMIIPRNRWQTSSAEVKILPLWGKVKHKRFAFKTFAISGCKIYKKSCFFRNLRSKTLIPDLICHLLKIRSFMKD